jgi:CBS domain-containing protein
MKVRHAMSTNVITATPDTPLIDAMRSMLREHISGLPVVDAHGALVGILTEADLMHRAEIETEAGHVRPAWLDFILGPGRQAREFTASHARHVGEVMTRDVITVDAGAPLIEAVGLMEKHRVMRLPVLRNQALVGILSRADLLRAFVRALPDAVPEDLSDAAIATRLRAEFDARQWTPRGTVHADVHDGVVTLHGVIVNDDVREALLVMTGNMTGVMRVEDQITTIEPMTGMVVHEPGA